MNNDELINSALNAGGKMIGGKAVFIIEGNPEKNELRVLDGDECLKNNLMAFTYGISHSYIMLGMFTDRETAEEQIEVIRKLFRDEEGRAIN